MEQGNSLTLICKSNANPAVTNYTWFKIRDAQISSIGFDCEFSIKAASQKDDGQYFCTAKNDMGSQNSTIITLKVKGNKEYFIHKERKEVCLEVNTSLMLTKYCAVYWILPDIYIFKKKYHARGVQKFFFHFKM